MDVSVNNFQKLLNYSANKQKEEAKASGSVKSEKQQTAVLDINENNLENAEPW